MKDFSNLNSKRKYKDKNIKYTSSLPSLSKPSSSYRNNSIQNHKKMKKNVK